MLFRRRARPTLQERLRVGVWPRVSWRRSGHYYLKRTLRLSGTPHAIALGAAIGAGVSLTPFIGLQFLITFALAWMLRGNLIAGAIGTCLANPLTVPFIWAGTHQLGQLILAGAAGPPPRFGEEMTGGSLVQIWPVIKPMLVGSIPLGAAAGGVIYLVVYKAVAVYRNARRVRFDDRRRQDSIAEQAAAERLARTESGSW